MKKILISSTALAAVLGGALLLIPGPAQASNARAKFGSMRAALKKLAQSGALSVSVTANKGEPPLIRVLVNGQPLPPDVPMDVKTTDGPNYIEYTVTIDLSDSAYKSINFGKDQNTLELIPKAAPTHREVVRVDPKTNALVSWSTLGLTGGAWKQLSKVIYDGKQGPPTGPATSSLAHIIRDEPAKPSDGLITMHIRLARSGGSATLSVKQN